MGKLAKSVATRWFWDVDVCPQLPSEVIYEGKIRAGIFQRGPVSRYDRIFGAKVQERYCHWWRRSSGSTAPVLSGMSSYLQAVIYV